MILTHGANSLQHGFTPKPIPDSYSRIYGIKKIGNHISGGVNFDAGATVDQDSSYKNRGYSVRLVKDS